MPVPSPLIAAPFPVTPHPPDMWSCLIRRSDQASRFRPRKVRRGQRQTHEPKFLMEVLVGETCSSSTWRLVLLVRPRAQLLHHVHMGCPVRFTDRTQTEVVAPTGWDPNELATCISVSISNLCGPTRQNCGPRNMRT